MKVLAIDEAFVSEYDIREKKNHLEVNKWRKDWPFIRGVPCC